MLKLYLVFVFFNIPKSNQKNKFCQKIISNQIELKKSNWIFVFDFWVFCSHLEKEYYILGTRITLTLTFPL